VLFLFEEFDRENKRKKRKQTIKVVGIISLLTVVVLGMCVDFSKDEKTPDKTLTSQNQQTDSNNTPVVTGTDISDLSENRTATEGKEGTGEYNYGEALQKSILFYDLQRSGKLPDNKRTNWRGDSGMDDGSDAGLDLTGGFYDAGDNVKFNLPMAYTGAMLAWSVIEDPDSYKESGQLPYILDNIRWVNDYLIKCHPEDNVYYYQVGDGNKDHAWWGACEVMQMERPSFKVDSDHPGSTVSAEAAASLAACSAVFKDTDPDYSARCLEHAKSLYKFAEDTKSDEGYTAANGFYNSWSGFYDELAWAAVWISIASEDSSYLKKADEYLGQSVGDYKWAHCWDDVYTGTCLLLAQHTNDKKYGELLERNLDFWTDGYNGEKISYTPDGLAWLDQWGSLRYATTEAFIASSYSQSSACPDNKKEKYWNFAVSQVNYALGSTGRSFVVGFGTDPPVNPHHRTSHSSYANNMNEPAEQAHTLYGALVGGPDSGGNYQDVITNYTVNEVACDYNAGFVCALAKMYGKFGGKTIPDFGAVEVPDHDELYAETSVNASGNDFTEIKAMLYNKTSWPARVTDGLELRYFIDLSEVYDAGGSADGIDISLNYAQNEVKASIQPWNEDKHIYYASIDFSGVKIYPGGQESYKKEVQFRMKSSSGVWNSANDYSFADLTSSNGSSMISADHCALYDNGKLVFGSEPDGEVHEQLTASTENKVTSVSENAETERPAAVTTKKKNTLSAENADVSVILDASQNGGGQNTIYFTVSVTNKGDSSFTTDALDILYYFSSDGADSSSINVWCDSAAVTSPSGNYKAVNDVSGKCTAFSASDNTADTVCTVSSSGSTVIDPGDTYKVQIRMSKNDWSDFNLTNDYSSGNAENIVIRSGDKTLSGNIPS